MYDVVIVGAGIAGLGAVQVITRDSHSVIIFEARSRSGRRIHSVRIPSTSVDFPASPASSSVNHDNLSVFHTVWNSQRTSIPDGSSNFQLPPEQPTHSAPRVFETSGDCVSPASFTDHMGPVDVDLGANYLIGCSNRQTDQPLFHMARMLRVPTATFVGDLCKNCRGCECAEFSTLRAIGNPVPQSSPWYRCRGGFSVQQSHPLDGI
ncbi:unnamed protein product [Dicrocoelium dendriticum]|nr:unnamed protein product [Dicrocoelium dendriticum]